jgi:hypothetical protein
MAKFPKTFAGAEVIETDLDQDDFEFRGERLTEQRAAQIAEQLYRKGRNDAQ